MSVVESGRYNSREMVASRPPKVWGQLESWEQCLCLRLVQGGGPLGWSDNSLWAAHIRKTDVEALVNSGLVIKAPLWAFAEALLREEQTGQIYYKKPNLNDPQELKVWLLCEFAREIVEDKENPENSEPRYQVARQDLCQYIKLF